MYEKPKLNCVGVAENVILGAKVFGIDLDITYVPPDPGGEWGDDDIPSAY